MGGPVRRGSLQREGSIAARAACWRPASASRVRAAVHRDRRVAIGSCAPDLQAVVHLAWGHPSHKATQGATTLLAAMACCFSAAADAPPQTPPPRRYRDRTPQEVGCPQAPPPPRSTAAGAHRTGLHRTALNPHFCPTAAYAQVEELRQRLSAIMPPLEVDWQQDATVNATRLPSTEAPRGASPFGASFAFQRRHSMRGQQAAAAAAAGQQSKQQSPQPDEQLHGDSRTASGDWRALWIVVDGCCCFGSLTKPYSAMLRLVAGQAASDAGQQCRTCPACSSEHCAYAKRQPHAAPLPLPFPLQCDRRAAVDRQPQAAGSRHRHGAAGDYSRGRSGVARDCNAYTF